MAIALVVIPGLLHLGVCMRLLIINPNTTAAMTAKVAAAARRILPDSVEISAVSGRFGPRYIASHAAFAVASHAALDAFAVHGAACDAVLLACFGDPGLEALREVSGAPVISLIDAACAEATAGGRRFTILTGGERWGPMLTAILRARGLDGHLASIRTVAPTGGTIAADPAGALDLLTRACEAAVDEDQAQSVILGGVGLIGLAAPVGARLRVPVICSVEAGLREAEHLAGARRGREARQTVPVESIGLSRDLKGLFRQGRARGVTPGR